MTYLNPANDPTLLAALAGKEAVLGNPTKDGQVLVSTMAGTRGWADAATGGGGNGSSISSAVVQTAHGFAVLTPIFYDIDANAWAKAKADSADTLATHVVTAVADADNFTAGQIGKFTVTAHGFAEGYWFTSATTAGGVTQDDQSYSNPVFFVLDADTVILLGFRPSSSNWDSSFMFPNEVAVTAAITFDEMNIGKLHVCSGTAADYAVILPTPVGHRGELIAFDMDAALTKVVTLDAGVGLTINGERYRKMWAKENCVLRSSGSEWKKIAGVTIPMSAGIGMNANQTFANSTVTKILFDASFSLNGPTALQEISSNQLRILRSGKYSIHAQYQWYWTNAPSTTADIWIKKNGVVAAQCGYSVYAGNGAVPEVTNPSVECIAGDYLTAHAAYHTSSLSPTIYGNTSNGPVTYLSLTEVPTW